MGSQGSKVAKGGGSSAPAAPTEPAKANGQENGHLRVNGATTARAGGEAAVPNGNGSSEPLGCSGDAIEPAPPAGAGDAQPEGAAAPPRDTPKKKKKFSFKKSFKLSGMSLRRSKKEAGDSAGSSPSEEQGQEGPGSAANGTEPPAAPGGGAERGGPAAGTEAGRGGEENEQQAAERPGAGAGAEPGEPSHPAGSDPAAAAEQHEE
ncbi:LOW QUALITY PROTEIN: MARCKS-related protein [Melopsittacus undulatus]|uniref:LOW QUALITY PROTEIN: MARCKS-related protein n=1 Tax=Melopsittacus undulatus TaxID=13146 RepID=UPI00146F3617|nr:LOW QUALITY PROTEIN: MARCKS-related protein [Melopsittacus undulatus]